jgi:hypothetical protein
MITPSVVTETNFSIAWARTFLALMEPSGNIRHPAIVVINGLENDVLPENQAIRALLDEELSKHGKNSCSTVASTIFPYSMWNPRAQDDAESLFHRYERAWPGIKKCQANRNGVYFRRLTAFLPKDHEGMPVNQLQFIVDTFRGGNHRKSALQASILDPTRDHTNHRMKGFPCMQQVSFTPLENDMLSITGFYATQYQFEKAYGNYLGLYWLGRFMAKQLGLKLSQVVCLASVLERGEPKKRELQSLANGLESMIEVAMVGK